jgi:hypothetical protein
MSRAPSFLRSAKGVAAYLTDSASLGLDRTLVLDLFDDTASAGDQLARIRDEFDRLLRERRAEERPVADLLIYYVGHGHTDDQGHLSLLVRRSRRGMEAETGIKAPDLARVLKIAAPQQRRAVILDCCFSEAAVRDFIGQSGTLDAAVAAAALKDFRDDQPQRGSLLLCSSPMGEVSMGAPKAERTLFTGAVLEVLRHGVEGAPSALSFADLRDAAYNRMVANFGANAPRPILHQVNAGHGDLTHTPAFPNRAERQLAPSLPADAQSWIQKILAASDDELPLIRRQLSFRIKKETDNWSLQEALDYLDEIFRERQHPLREVQRMPKLRKPQGVQPLTLQRLRIASGVIVLAAVVAITGILSLRPARDARDVALDTLNGKASVTRDARDLVLDILNGKGSNR